MDNQPTASQLALLRNAQDARKAAYAPYSNFKVGAAVRTRSGRIYTGCNVENASYGLCICAERVAIFSAVSAGDPQIVEIAVCTGADQPSPPCGACRQVLFEFGPTASVIMGSSNGLIYASPLSTLFPEPFGLPKAERPPQ
jgi:cytidine deaminase